MKKFIACLLALPLALTACGAQTTDAAPSQPTTETEQTAETTETAPVQAADTGIAGRLREASMMMSTGSCVYSINEKWDAATGIETIYLIKTDYATATNYQRLNRIQLICQLRIL